MPARFLSSSLPAPTETLRLDGAEGHHLSRVLRVRVGEAVEGLDGKGTIWSSTVVEAGKNGVLLQGERVTTVPKPTPDLGVAMALLKPQAMEWAVQKASELGVTHFYPVLTEHTVARLGKDREARWLQRMERIVEASLKQCGRAWRPTIHAPMRWKEFMARPLNGARFIAELGEGTVPLAEGLEGCSGEATILVGPEGDFSETEGQDARQAGWTPVSLGESVLRAETAVLYALSAMVYTQRRDTR